MKKLLSAVLSVLMLLSVVTLAGCGDETQERSGETLKLGLGVHSYIEKIENAEGDKKGGGEATTTVAAVLLDKNGKIVKCALDTAANPINFTSDGKAEKAGEMKTKYEKGKDYGMVAYGGAKKEWYEQADAFVSVVKGKNLAEVKALMTEDKKGTQAVIDAGCTITVSDFVIAIEKAVNNAADSKAVAKDDLKVGIVSTQSTTDASGDKDGSNSIETTIVVAALGKDGKVTASTNDCVATEIKFDSKGASKTQFGVSITTKRTAKDEYGMVAHGGAKKEWFEQANAFANAVVGKNADEIAKLEASEGKGSEELQTAGCTIVVSDLVKAAVKAAK